MGLSRYSTIGRIIEYLPEANTFDIVVADSHITVVYHKIVNLQYLYYYSSRPVIQKDFESCVSCTANQIEFNAKMVRMKPILFSPLKE